MPKIFIKRNFVGALLFLLLIGELSLAPATGLFTPAGFIALPVMYFLLFLSFESLIVRYRLVNCQVVLVNFALYSVLITGFFHHELAGYRDANLILVTTMIRLQSAVVPAFLYVLLDRWLPRDEAAVPSVKKSLIALTIWFSLLSLAGGFALPSLIQTFTDVPLISVIYVLLAALAIQKAIRWSGEATELQGYVLLVFIMPIAYAIFSRKKWFRQQAV
jgi:hypothetical protein